MRVDAVVALRAMVEAYDDDALEAIKPLVPALLNELFALMNEVRVHARVCRVPCAVCVCVCMVSVRVP